MIGPFSLRVYMTIIMMVFLIIMSSKKQYLNPCPITKSFLKVYFLFILFGAIALILNGEYVEYDFNKLLLANFLNCFVSYYAIDYFVTDKKKLRNLLCVLTLLIVFDSFVTVLQFAGNPVGNIIAAAFTTVSEVRSNIAEENPFLTFGANLPRGLFGYVFTNGTMIATLGALCFYLTAKREEYKSYLLVPMLLFCLYASFVTQERAAFVLFLLVSFFLFYIGPSTKAMKIIAAIVVLFLIVAVLPTLMFSEKLGRFAISGNSSEEIRIGIWTYCFSFIMDNLLLGGPVSYFKKTDAAPHNFFLFVFIHYGLIAGLLISYLYIKMLLQVIRNLLRRYSYETTILAGAVLIYSLLSLFHNASIATGDTIIFIIYPLLLKSLTIDKKKVRIV